MSQDIHLFSDSILSNITLQNTNISFLRVKDAAKEIEIDDFISSLPDGYNYNVRERGVGLSTGQRQLISFLRAYIKNPQILVLDEATSSLDSRSEKKIHDSLDKLISNKTALIIAHRLSTVIDADRIVIINNGEVVDIGKHSTLIKSSKIYKHLHELQFKTKNEKNL